MVDAGRQSEDRRPEEERGDGPELEAYRPWLMLLARMQIDREWSLEQLITRSSQRLEQFLRDAGPSPSGLAMQREQALELAEVLERLPDEYREVIVLRNLEGLSHHEVAVRMGRSTGAVRMLWLRALEQLRSELDAGSRPGNS